MRSALAICLALNLVCLSIAAQEKSFQQTETIGIHFIFNDFATALDIRSSSLASVLNNKRFGKLKDMSQGLALSYSKSLSKYFDFSSMVAGSFLAYPIPGKEDQTSESLLLETDASIRGRMFSNEYWVVPYLQLGVGFSYYKGYWGAFIPAGVGLQINFFDEAYLMINSQYRIAVSETANYHFVHSIGLVGNIGN
jgi:hypothetical protein